VTYDFCEVLALVFGKLPRLHTQKPNVGATMEVLTAGFLDVKCIGLHLFQLLDNSPLISRLWWIQRRQAPRNGILQLQLQRWGRLLPLFELFHLPYP
jgi:hypothetical protein